MQFDAGRGTTMRLSKLNITPAQVNVVFFTHMHSDHADGFADLIQLRWHFNSKDPKIDAIGQALGDTELYVRFGSKADIRTAKSHVRFTPRERHHDT
jgi:ribonuclease BN (tRNA processing enzyme)